MKRGRPKSTENKIQIASRVTPEVAQKLQDRAEREGRSRSNLIAWICTQAVEEEEE